VAQGAAVGISLAPVPEDAPIALAWIPFAARHRIE
jgi:hypothetical protein